MIKSSEILKRKCMGAITIFFKNGRVIGSCGAGNESEWANGHKREKQIEYDKTISSTDDKWHEWARIRCHKSESEAQKALY